MNLSHPIHSKLLLYCGAFIFMLKAQRGNQMIGPNYLIFSHTHAFVIAVLLLRWKTREDTIIDVEINSW